MKRIQYRSLYWHRMCERTRASRQKALARSVFLGDHYDDKYPLILKLESLLRHIQVFGGSGDGKTVIALQLAIQLLWLKCAALIVFDCKGSRLLLNALLAAAEEIRDPTTGEPFFDVKVFTPATGAYSHTWNPLLDRIWRRLTPLERAEVLLDAFDIRPIEGSEAAFFAVMCELVTTSYLEWHQLLESFEQLYRLMDDREVWKGLGGQVADWSHGRQTVAFLKRLAACPALKSKRSADESSLDIESILTGKRLTITYFSLAMMQDRRVSQTVLRLFSKLLLRGAIMLRAERKCHQVVVLCDEMQHCVGPLLVDQLEQSREMTIAYWLFGQSRQQLVTPAGDYRDTLDNCVGLQMMLAGRDRQSIEYIEGTSPEVTYHSLKWTQGRQPGDSIAASAFDIDRGLYYFQSGGQQVDVSEYRANYPDRNRIIQVSADPQGGLVRLMRNEGLWAFGGAWVPFRWHRNMTPAEYHAFSNAQPVRLPGMILNTPPAGNVADASIPPLPGSELLAPVTTSVNPTDLTAALRALAEKLGKS